MMLCAARRPFSWFEEHQQLKSSHGEADLFNEAVDRCIYLNAFFPTSENKIQSNIDRVLMKLLKRVDDGSQTSAAEVQPVDQAKPESIVQAQPGGINATPVSATAATCADACPSTPAGRSLRGEKDSSLLHTMCSHLCPSSLPVAGSADKDEREQATVTHLSADSGSVQTVEPVVSTKSQPASASLGARMLDLVKVHAML